VVRHAEPVLKDLSTDITSAYPAKARLQEPPDQRRGRQASTGRQGLPNVPAEFEDEREVDGPEWLVCDEGDVMTFAGTNLDEVWLMVVDVVIRIMVSSICDEAPEVLLLYCHFRCGVSGPVRSDGVLIGVRGPEAESGACNVLYVVYEAE
jgi:hypothetical protein